RHFISQSQVKQRMGRSGRTSPGICYHLYTENEYESMIKYPTPSIKSSNIFPESFKLLKDIKNLKDLKSTLNSFIDPPNKEYLEDAFSIMREKKLVTRDVLNQFGIYVLNFQEDPLDTISLII